MRVETNKAMINNNKVPDTTDKVPNSASKVPDTTDEVPDNVNKVPDNVQEQQIYRYVLENGSITTAKTVEILDVKHRRARAVLLNMVKDGYLRKRGCGTKHYLCKKYGREICIARSVHKFFTKKLALTS